MTAVALRRLPILLSAVWLASAATVAQDRVEIVVRLEQGRFYSRNQVHAELNQKLRTDYPVRPEADERLELTAVDRAALRVAAATGALRVRFGDDRIVISLPAEGAEGQFSQLLPIGWGLDVPAGFSTLRKSVVLIHGLESGPGALRRLGDRFRRRGWQVLAFDYPNDGPLADSGARLSSDLKRLQRRHRDLEVVVVAHSMGGLVARHAVETPELNPGCVTDLVMLGTPHRGSALARWQPELELLSEFFPAERNKGWNSFNDGRGEAARDLLPGSDFLKRLNASRRPREIRYHVAVGTHGLMTEGERARLLQDVGRWTARLRLTDRQAADLKAALQGDELVTGKGDGAVSIESAELPRANRVRRFALNHLELIDPPPALVGRSESVFGWIELGLGR